MRRLLVLGAALGLLLVLQQFGVNNPDSLGVSPLTLAAVGFVVLTAFTIGEIGAGAGLPKITGYILSGIVLGPHFSKLIDFSPFLGERVVKDMQLFNELALGLIALTAGLELHLVAVKRVLRTLLATLVFKIPLLLLLVGGGFILFEQRFHVLDIHSTSSLYALALLLAVLGIGTSPAIVLAVSNDAKAKGKLTELSLAMAVVKDLVVVVSLAIAIAIAKTMLDDGGGHHGGGHHGGEHHSLDTLIHVGQGITWAIFVGAILGALFVLYIRYIHAEMLLAVLVGILVGGEVARALHFEKELLLMFISAGFVVRNLSEHAEQLHHPLERVALPVFVVFFTTVGARVDLEATALVLPAAGFLVAARMAAYFLAARIGAWLGQEEKAVSRNAWLAYWPQAGIALGLVQLAADNVQPLGPTIMQVGFAAVAINLLIGPIMLGWSLRRAGETPNSSTNEQDAPTEAPPDKPVESTKEIPASVGHLSELPEEKPPVPLEELITYPPLRKNLRVLESDLIESVNNFLDKQVAPLSLSVTQLTDRMFEDPETSKIISNIRKALADQPADNTSKWVAESERLRRELTDRVQRLPVLERTPLSDIHLVRKSDDSPLVSIARLWLRFLRATTRTRARTREVKLRVIARHRMEPRITIGVRKLAEANFEHYARVLDQVRTVVAGTQSYAQAKENITQLHTQWLQACKRALVNELREGLAEVAKFINAAGTPGAEAHKLRLSEVQANLRANVEGLRKDIPRWRRVVSAGVDTLRAETLVAAAEERLDRCMERRIRGPLHSLTEQILPTVQQVAERLEKTKAEVEAKPPPELSTILSRTRAAYPRSERSKLRRARARFRRQTHPNKLIADMGEIWSSAPQKLELFSSLSIRKAKQHLDRITVSQVPFQERMQAPVANIISNFRGVLETPGQLVASLDGKLEEAVHLATYGVEAAAGVEATDGSRIVTASRALERARDAIRTIADELEKSSEQANQEATKAAGEGAKAIRAIIRTGGPSTVQRVRTSFRAKQLALQNALADFAKRTWNRAEVLIQEILLQAGYDITTTKLPKDARSIRTMLDVNFPPPEALGLPSLYVKVFQPDPVEDARLAIAYRSDVERIARALSQSPGDKIGGHVIIEGPRGSGRTSFINLLELRISSRRVLRIDATFHPRDEGLVGALAAELGCPDYPLAVNQSLQAEPTVVIIDDLGHHVMPTPAGIQELQELLRIAVDTHPQVFWVITAESDKLSVLSSLVPIGGVFTERHQLAPLTAEELEHIIEARRKLAGLDIWFVKPSLFGKPFSPRRQVRRAKQNYFRRLAHASGGILREALMIHLRSLRSEPEGALSAQLPKTWTLDGLESLEPIALGSLCTVARFGAMHEDALAEALLLDRDQLRQHTKSLLHAGLLEVVERHVLGIPIYIQTPLTQSLRRLGLLGEVKR